MSLLSSRILNFWFKGKGLVIPPTEIGDLMGLWYSSNTTIDSLIKTEFEKDLLDFKNYEVELKESPESTLSLIILLDQFPRNMYRNTADAFKYDLDALSVTLYSIEKGFDTKIDPFARQFIYLPLEHSESLEMQELAFQKFTALASELPSDMKAMGESFVNYSLQHKSIIERFNRFPHRNFLLNRQNTPEEEEFLIQQGGSMFGVGEKSK